jgi:hypothetical protein
MAEHAAQLDQTLRRTGRVYRRAQTLRAAAVAVASLLVAGLAAVFIDALFGLNAAALRTIDGLLIAGAIGAVLYVLRAATRDSYHPRRIARMLESAMNITDSRLINAVDLAGVGGSVSVSLRGLAIAEGDAAAAAVVPSRVVDLRALRRALLATLIAALVPLSGWLLAPRLFNMVVPRYLNPAADLPPFTLLRFAIHAEPDKIYYGKPATIRVELASPLALPETATVVFTDPDGKHASPMVRESDGRFVLSLDHVERSRRFYVATPDGRSAIQTLAVLPVPLFERIRVKYEYPAYTGWTAVERPLEEDGVRALIGTHVKVTVKANTPDTLFYAAFVPTDAGEHAEAPFVPSMLALADPIIDGSGLVVSDALGTSYHPFELTQSGTLRVYLETKAGMRSEIRGIAVQAIADVPPQVQLMEPDLRVIAPEGYALPVAIAASDDVGVREVVLHALINGKPATPIPMTLTFRGPMYASGRASLDLAAIGAKAGDVVKGFATAFDNHPDPPQSADSPAFEVRVVTMEQYKQQAREQYRVEQLALDLEKFEAAVQKIAEQREKLIEQMEKLQKKMEANGGKLDEADQKALDDIQKQLADYAEQSKKLAAAMAERAAEPELYEFEKEFNDLLKATAEQLADQAGAAEQNAGAVGKERDGKSLAKALARLKEDRHEGEEQADRAEQAKQGLELLAMADAMMAEIEEIVRIAGEQRELADRMNAYGAKQDLGTAEKARLARLADEQHGLREDLEESLQKLEKAATAAGDKLPKMSRSARKIISDIRSGGAMDDQDAAAEAGEQGDGPRAAAAADSAAKKLEAMIGQCEECNGDAASDLDGALKLSRPQLGKALGQMKQGRGKGKGTGRGSGSGSGGRSGDSPGGNGGSSDGAARPSLAGPHGNISSGDLGPTKKEAKSFSQASTALPLDERQRVQRIDAQTRNQQAGDPGASGVPAQYRGLAEQYFRRLAEDNR